MYILKIKYKLILWLIIWTKLDYAKAFDCVDHDKLQKIV